MKERAQAPSCGKILAETGDGFVAEAFTWRWWTVTVLRYELSVSRFGRIGVGEVVFAEQPSE